MRTDIWPGGVKWHKQFLEVKKGTVKYLRRKKVLNALVIIIQVLSVTVHSS